MDKSTRAPITTPEQFNQLGYDIYVHCNTKCKQKINCTEQCAMAIGKRYEDYLTRKHVNGCKGIRFVEEFLLDPTENQRIEELILTNEAYAELISNKRIAPCYQEVVEDEGQVAYDVEKNVMRQRRANQDKHPFITTYVGIMNWFKRRL